MSRVIQYGSSVVDKHGVLQKKYTVVECCGDELYCYGFTNTCPICGSDYNQAGQRLAPREQWGEETGEHYTDILTMREPWDDNY
jgi:hypothetical protein